MIRPTRDVTPVRHPHRRCNADRFGWLAGRILADLDVVKLDPPETQRGLADWRAFNINKRIADFDPDLPADRLLLDELFAKTDICLLPADARNL